MAQSLRDVALDQGLEIETPLFEIARGSMRARPATSPDQVIAELSDVLVRLFHEGRIAVFEGPWEVNDPPRVYGADAVDLLTDLRRYRFENEDVFDLHRVYYINVDNLAD